MLTAPHSNPISPWPTKRNQTHSWEGEERVDQAEGGMEPALDNVSQIWFKKRIRPTKDKATSKVLQFPASQPSEYEWARNDSRDDAGADLTF